MATATPMPGDREFVASMERMGYVSAGVPRRPQSAVGVSLLPFRVALTVREALTMLTEIGSRARLLALYKHYFPDEYAASSASMVAAEGQYSDREVEFFRLVDQRLFPLDEWKLEHGRMISDTLPVSPQGIDWWEIELIEWRQAWQFLLVLTGAVPPEHATEYARDLLIAPDELQAIEDLGDIDPDNPPWGALTELCGEMDEDSPLRHMLTAAQIILHCTGNQWLDLERQAVVNLRWCREHMDSLALLWRGDPMRGLRGADDISRCVAELVDWIEASHDNRMACIRFWGVVLDDEYGPDRKRHRGRARLRIGALGDDLDDEGVEHDSDDD